jgi:hypothetical protein
LLVNNVLCQVCLLFLGGHFEYKIASGLQIESRVLSSTKYVVSFPAPSMATAATQEPDRLGRAEYRSTTESLARQSKQALT